METVVTAFLNITQISLVCQSIQDMQKKEKKTQELHKWQGQLLAKENF